MFQFIGLEWSVALRFNSSSKSLVINMFILMYTLLTVLVVNLYNIELCCYGSILGLVQPVTCIPRSI